MRDTTRSFAKMAMHALLRRENTDIDPGWIAKTAWQIAEEMEAEAVRLDKEAIKKEVVK